MNEKPLASTEHHLCTNVRVRLYYLGMAGIFAITLFIEVVALGSFGIQFSRTRSFWVNNVNGDSKVCVLYGTISNTINPMLAYNAACGFVLWALITIVVELLTWTIYYGVLVVIGRPKVTSLLRILDLGIACSMAILSSVVSSVLTDGFYKTCGSFNRGIYDIPCNRRQFMAVGNSETLTFFGNLEAAKDASWVVMIIFTLLACWNVVLLFLHCCFNLSTEERTKLIEKKVGEEKAEPRDFPDFPEEEWTKQTEEKSEPRDFPDFPEEEWTKQTEEKSEEKKSDIWASWNVLQLFLPCCFKHSTEEKNKLMGKKVAKKKSEPRDFPDFPDEEEKSKLIGKTAKEKESEARDFPDFP